MPSSGDQSKGGGPQTPASAAESGAAAAGAPLSANSKRQQSASNSNTSSSISQKSYASAIAAGKKQSQPQETGHSSENSLSTTPTQSQINSAPTSSSRQHQHQQSSSTDTIGKGQPPPLSSQQQQRQGRMSMSGDRSTSYATSEIDTVSGLSASEYSSGEEEGGGRHDRRGLGAVPNEGVRGGAGAGGRGRTSFAAAPGTSVPSSSLSRSTGQLAWGQVAGAPGGASKSSSKASGARRSSVQARNTSKARRGSMAPKDFDDYDEEDGRYGPLDDEDDEVEPHDRGEELVRRRMKARQREKAARIKAEKQRERQQQQQQQKQQALSPRLRPTSPAVGSSAGQLERDGRPTHIALPPLDGSTLAPTSASSTMTAPLSPGTVRGPLSYPSPHSHIRRPSTHAPSAQQQVQHQQQQPSSSSGARRMSGMSGVSVSTAGWGATGQVGGGGIGPQGGSTGARMPQAAREHDVFSDGGEVSLPTAGPGSSITASSDVATSADREFDTDEERDTVARLATDAPSRSHTSDSHGEGPSEDGRAGSTVIHDDEQMEEDGDNATGDAEGSEGEGEMEGEGEGEESGEVSPDSGLGDDDGSDDGDVEYTLKDRQDAINIEHPFGLPIWKPALYKKSRTVTRNAESALHSIPSAAAERHLLPGNLLWTIFAGLWLSAVCFVCAIVVNLVPFGGSRYARVIWELGGYLFWPFGKYVEVEVAPGSIERIRGTTAAYDNEHASQGYAHQEGSYEYENSFTPVAARYPHDHHHTVYFNSKPTTGTEFERHDTLRQEDFARESEADTTTATAKPANQGGDDLEAAREALTETSSLRGKARSYGTITENGKSAAPLTAQERLLEEQDLYGYVQDENGRDIDLYSRLPGMVAYLLGFWLVIAPLMGLFCLTCWFTVFPIPMAKLNWVLLKNLSRQPLALHFRRAPRARPSSAAGTANGNDAEDEDDDRTSKAQAIFLPLKPGQFAPGPKKTNGGRLVRRSKILLCTYRAMGLQYYKYTVGGVNILFVNTLPFVFFTIADFFLLEPYVHRHHITGFLKLISAEGTVFVFALGSVIPLSYFIGMAVASISAQSSIGMGAVINATFGSIIEIILYAIALTQHKARLVEGSLVGSILAGVLLMPGISMCSGATRRKEQRFNARSAGVTSTMLIMAIIGILTPTLFYQIYGTFQLTCKGCPEGGMPGEAWTCKRCYYQHVPPATDPFYQDNVKGLMYTCTVVLVLSYGVGLWFSLRTHASQIWQNPQPVPAQLPAQVGLPQHQSGQHAAEAGLPAQQQPQGILAPVQRNSIYKRLVPNIRPVSQGGSTLKSHRSTAYNPTVAAEHSAEPSSASRGGAGPTAALSSEPAPLQLPESFSQADYERAVALTASAFHSAMREQQQQQQQQQQQHRVPPAPTSATKHISMHESEHPDGGGGGGHGGHDAPSWTRATSLIVLISCTILYAVIAEILVDAVDVVLAGSGLDIKLLGVTLFALVPNATEFMNAMSFAINGNIALSMEIGSAYALQVCLIQIPAMVAFSAWYNAGKGGAVDINTTFSLIFPRWDVIAVIFAIFLLTYTYIESRSNYFRGTLCILSYVVLVSGFVFAPSTGDSEDPGDDGSSAGGFGGSSSHSLQHFSLSGNGAFGASPLFPSGTSGSLSAPTTVFGGLTQPTVGFAPALAGLQWIGAVVTSLWTR